MFNLCNLNKLSPKVLARLGNDLRKAGYLIGVGFVGLVLSNDNISVKEGLALFIWGLYTWILGHIALYISERNTKRQNQGD